MKRILYTLIILSFLWPMSLPADTNSFQTPDFAFPKEVEANASAALDKALAKGDQATAVRALVQISLAKSTISRHEVTPMCRFIDSVRTVGKFSADHKALLDVIQAQMLDALMLPEKGDDMADDIALWSRAKRDSLSRALMSRAIAQDKALLQPVERYKGILTSGNAIGRRCQPLLYDFVARQMLRVLQADSLREKKEQFFDRWLSVHAQDSNALATLYIEKLRGKTPINELLQRYKGREESGLLLADGSLSKEDGYDLCKQYIKKFPISPFCTIIRLKVLKWEQKEVNLQSENLISTRDSIRSKVTLTNLDQCQILLCRIPDELKLDGKIVNLSQLQRVDSIIARDGNVRFAPQDFGRYMLVPSFALNEKETAQDNTFRYSESNWKIIRVSDIRSFYIQDWNDCKIFAVSHDDGHPIEGTTVEYSRTWSQAEGKQGLTNADGFLSVQSDTPYTYTLRRGKDCHTPQTHTYRYGMGDSTHLQTDIFTDLAIYRPGEEVKLSAIVYQVTPTTRRPMPNLTLKLKLQDNNWNTIDSLQCKTDEWGAADVHFTLPADRMNGRFNMVLFDDDRQLAWREIQVSEYKQPTFSIDLTPTATRQELNRPLVISGRCTTFSGIPFADREVRCQLIPRRFFWHSNLDLDEQEFTVETDAEGNFHYICPAEWTTWEEDDDDADEDDAYECCPHVCFMQLKTECTDAAGETQSAATMILLGSGCRVWFAEEDILIKSDGKSSLPVRLESPDPKETSVMCQYELLTPSEKTVRKGKFNTADPTVNWGKVPSGSYLLKIKVLGQKNGGCEEDVLLYRENDTMPPYNDGIWIPKGAQRITTDGKASCLIGNASDVHIYYVASTRNKVVGQGWLHYAPGMHRFEMPMPSDRDEKLTIQFFGCMKGNLCDRTISFIAPERDEVKLQTVSFRDKVMPSGREHWSFKLTRPDGTPVAGRMMLELYSKALDALQSNKWNFSPNFANPYEVHSCIGSQSRLCFSTLKFPKTIPWSKGELQVTLPALNLYDRSDFFSNRAIRRGVLKFGQQRASETETMADVVDLSADSGPCEEEEACSGGLSEVETVGASFNVQNALVGRIGGISSSKTKRPQDAALSSLPVRSTQTHVALWRPTLTAGDDGIFSLDFDLPDENATWILQALAYTKTLSADVLRREIVAQRPVMVQPSLPRFLRTGDVTSLLANVQNATDSALHVTTLVELFDPRTEAILSTRTETLDIAAHGTRTVGIECRAMANAPYVGFRVRAVAADGNGDGEQQRIPILPATSPVTEAQPFYLAGGQTSTTLDVTRPSAENRRSTLLACSNPTWHCISALPSLANADAVTSTGLAHSLFARALAATLIDTLPALPQMSALRRNADLRIGTLQASPWLPDAEWQERRIAAIGQLLDSVANADALAQLYDKLRSMQTADGGFLWIGDAKGSSDKASLWATTTVVQLVGELCKLGALPSAEKWLDIVRPALHFIDRETSAIEQDMKKSNEKVDYLTFADYAYTRQLFDGKVGFASADAERRASDIIRRTTNALAERWRELSLPARASAAIILNRNGRTDEARRIVESLRQMAVVTPQRGMYWERIGQGTWFHPVACTAAVLEAFNEVAADAEARSIEAIRQWLLLEKQTSDWGTSSMAAHAIYVLLRTGDDWPGSASDTTTRLDIRLNGAPLSWQPEHAALGDIRLTLADTVRTVSIGHNAPNPAWGAVVHQYEAPMQSVTADATDELRIRKEFWVEAADGSWSKAPVAADGSLQFHVGQRVQVRLVIVCTKELEYLTLADERPAFLEPVDQTSGYRWDGTFHYLETKDSQTRLYFTRLAEGSHVATYDCHVTNSGRFAVGIATIQSQYAPQFVAHSAGGTAESRK
ncbi:MAG: hypothetical protein K6E73_08365 [Bacteroidales bacterium]|nr:hypothetical protein [Bacteroidales bacterium]